MKNASVFLLVSFFLFNWTLAPAQPAGSTYAVTFRANISQTNVWETGPGHVWVEFLLDGKSQKKIGFYRKGLKDEQNRRSDIDYTFVVTKSAYEAGLEVTNQYFGETYIPGFNDCRTFAQKVGRALGLDVPNTGAKSPAEWLADLVEKNQFSGY